jgi:hypothetical protein
MSEEEWDRLEKIEIELVEPEDFDTEEWAEEEEPEDELHISVATEIQMRMMERAVMSGMEAVAKHTSDPLSSPENIKRN